MNFDQGRLSFAAGIDNEQLRADAAESRNILSSIGRTAVQESERMDNAFSKIAKAAGGFFAVSGATEFAKKIISVRGEIESLEISFETLAGKTKGAELFGDIRQFAVSTPMMMKDLAAGAQTMLAFNIEAEKVMPMLRAIGDISMGDAQKFNSLTLAFSQMSATGKLMGQDLLQMINAGFNPLSVISEKTGKTIGELKEEMEKGKISTDMVTEAFIAATSAGGKFHGMLEKQSHGINGAISNMQGAIEDMLNDFGAGSQGVVVEAIDVVTSLAKHYEEVGEIIAFTVGTYGLYKAALIANIAIENATTAARAERIAAIEAEIAAVGQVTSAETAATQVEVAEISAKYKLSKAEAEHIVALRAEAAARIENLRAAAATTAAETAAAIAEEKTARARFAASVEFLKAKEAELVAAKQSGDQFAIAAAQKEVDAAATKRDAAASELNAASKSIESARAKEVAAAEAVETAGRNLNSTSLDVNTRKTSLLAIAKTQLTRVTQRLNAVVMQNPWVIAAAAVGALAYGIYKLATYETDAEKAQRKLNQSIAECNGQWAAEKIQIDVMFDRLKKAKEGTEAYKDAKEAIISQYGNYLNGLGEEVSSLKDVEAAYLAVTSAANKSARARAAQAFINEEGNEYSKESVELYDDIKKIIVKKKGEAFFKAYEKDINDVLNGKKEWSKELLTQFDEIVNVPGSQFTMPQTYTVNFLKSKTEEYLKNEADYKKLVEDTYSRYNLSGNDEDSTENTTEEPARIWKDEVAAQQKALTDAQAELKVLQNSADATTEQVTNAQNKIDEAKKRLKNLGVDVDSQDKGRDKSTEVAETNADLLKKEAYERLRQMEDYTRQMTQEAKDSEFEIRQAQIDAMKEGIEKEMMQNELNYDRITEQHARKAEEMLDELAQQRLRQMEESYPMAFLKTDKDGKLTDDNIAREEALRTIRASLTVEDLSDEQKQSLNEMGRIAGETFRRANEDCLMKMLDDVLTYEQQRLKITEDYSKKRNALYESDGNGGKRLRSGVSQGNIDEINRQEAEALKGVDEQFAQREETYQAWCGTITDLTLDKLTEMLDEVEARLAEMEDDGDVDSQTLARFRAMQAQLQQQKKKKEGEDNASPGKRTIKEWQDLYETLNDVKDAFEEIGDAVSGTIGEIISECGAVTTSTLSMINGIVTLANWSAISVKMTAEGASAAILTMEKASVILTVITAAMQIAMQIASLFNNDKAKQEEIEDLQTRIDQLQWELDHQEAGRIQQQYGSAIERVSRAVAESRRELGLVERQWQRLFNVAFKASQNQELMSRSAEKLAKAYASVAYSADKAFGDKKYDSARDQLENLAKQQILIQEQIQAEASKKNTDDSAIQDWKNKIEELGEQAVAVINDVVEEIIGDSSNSIAQELGDAFIEAFQAGENAAEAWGDKVNDIVADVMKRMMVSKYLEEPLGEVFDKYKNKWFHEGQFLGLDNVVDSMQGFADDLNAVGTEFAGIWENLPDSVKNMFTITSDAEREASQKGIATADQDSIDELNGRMTAVQGHTFSISENIKTTLAVTQSILRSVMNIESETSGFGARLERMEGNVKEMANTLDDIATKGIRLK